MVMKCTAVCLVALAMLGSFCDAQGQHPYTGYSKPGGQNPGRQVPKDPQQHKQSFEKPLTWTYPAHPTPKPTSKVEFEVRHPVPLATVAVECRENMAHVEVKKDMFGTGQFINPADLSLGNCGPVSEDNAAQVLIYQSELHDCGSNLMMTDDSLIYIFTLDYNPSPVVSAPVVRTSRAAVIVECHYPRKHNVSSLPLEPLWVPFSSVKVAEEFLYFTLKLMTDDWQYDRPSHQYFLGDKINFEATVAQYFHVPLRVFVASCVATSSPDSGGARYSFIDNNGCFIDAKITGSDSKFLFRSADDKLQFELETFRFQGIDAGLLYITCHLKATAVTHSSPPNYRACSYINGWREASGVDSACNSCDQIGTTTYGTTTGTSWNPGVTSGGTTKVTSGGTTRVTSGGTTRVTSGGTTRVTSGGTTRGTSGGTTRVTSGGTTRVTSGGTTRVPSGGTTRVTSGGDHTRKSRAVAQNQNLDLEGWVNIGPIRIEEKPEA